MKRIRVEKDESETLFTPTIYGLDDHYHAEIRVSSAEELRDLKRSGKLIAVRMTGTLKGGKRQNNLVPLREIEDFD